MLNDQAEQALKGALKILLEDQIRWWELVRHWVDTNQVDNDALHSAATVAENQLREMLDMPQLEHKGNPPQPPEPEPEDEPRPVSWPWNRGGQIGQ